MNLMEQINLDIKSAMKERDKLKLEALRAIKSALLIAATEKGAESSEASELKMLQKLVKQRKDAADIYLKEGRGDLAQVEMDQYEVINNYLPEQLSEDEIQNELNKIIEATGANSMKDMGKVMGLLNQKIAGKADGGLVAQLVKKALA